MGGILMIYRLMFLLIEKSIWQWYDCINAKLINLKINNVEK
jgi:hypothetical protein